MVEHLSTMWETRVRSLGWEDPLEKEMAIHSRTIAWKIPWTEEPGRLQSTGSQRVGHNWATSLHFTSWWTLCNPMVYTVHGILQARILEWVAFPFSRGSSWPRNQTRISCIAGGFFTNWAITEATQRICIKLNIRCSKRTSLYILNHFIRVRHHLSH